VSMEDHGEIMPTGENSSLPPELSGNPTNRAIWEQVGGMDEGSENFSSQAFHSH
jgi:hypothetical protein